MPNAKMAPTRGGGSIVLFGIKQNSFTSFAYDYRYIHVYIYIYIYIQRGYAPFRRAWAVGFGTWEGAFWSHVEVFWGPSWGLWRSKLEVWEPFWGLCWVL